MLRRQPEGDAAGSLDGARWIDLVNATDAERQLVEAATGLRVPTLEEVVEIESSSRVRTERGAFYLTMPLATLEPHAPATGVGFALGERVLITTRFADDPVFDAVFQSRGRLEQADARDIFLAILEALVDRGADALEHASAELNRISHATFDEHSSDRRRRRSSPALASRALRRVLRGLGGIYDRVSQIRDTLLSVNRIATYVSETAEGALSPAHVARLKAIRADGVSLSDYQSALSTKVQFLLDATLGFINIEQNDIVKTLTIASVVGVPPVLVAGIYGMNFHVMPELGWHLGYPLALALIVITTLLPVAWFKRRGWM
jgi:magnesium transporter